MTEEYRLVPYEPTEQQRRAACGVWRMDLKADGSVETPVSALYKAMLDNAPAVSVTEGPLVKRIKELEAALTASEARVKLLEDALRGMRIVCQGLATNSAVTTEQYRSVMKRADVVLGDVTATKGEDNHE